MATYSFVRSQVQTFARALPIPSLALNDDLLLLHVGRGRGLVVGGIAQALMGDADVAEIDVELVALGLLAGLADRHHDAAPVGVLAGAGGLHQRRIGDRERDALGRLARGRAFDADLDEFARALAVADDLMREIEQQLVERALEGGEPRIGGVGDFRRAALLRGAGREQQQRVGGRSVAVDGDRS